MKPVSRVNNATEDNKESERNSASPESFSSKSSSGSSNYNSALSRTPSDENTLGADAELGEDAGEDGGNVSNLGHRAQDLVTRFAGQAKEYGGKAVEQTGSFVKRHPGPTLLAGFGVGILVGVAIARR
jgi:ElaB/YqjD/DUF883 family membrane-anchored ribosome-binding protein